MTFDTEWLGLTSSQWDTVSRDIIRHDGGASNDGEFDRPAAVTTDVFSYYIPL